LPGMLYSFANEFRTSERGFSFRCLYFLFPTPPPSLSLSLSLFLAFCDFYALYSRRFARSALVLLHSLAYICARLLPAFSRLTRARTCMYT